MPVSDAKRRADAKYRSLRRKQLQLDFKAEDYEAIKAYCEDNGVKIATFCKAVIWKAINEGYKPSED